MRLTTNNLILRTVGREDMEQVCRMWDYEHGEISVQQAEQAMARMDENHQKNRPGYIYHLCLAVAEKSDPGRIIGWCGLDGTSGEELHIFYSILPQLRGRGYATQAARALLEYAFTNAQVPYVNGGCYKDNLASYRVMEKAGMRRAGTGENSDPLFFINRETYLDDIKIT